MKQSARKLTGDHNMCTTCGEYFNSSRAFDKHRTGQHGVDRRCMSPDEMRAAGMTKNAGDWWITSAMSPGMRGRFTSEVHP